MRAWAVVAVAVTATGACGSTDSRGGVAAPVRDSVVLMRVNDAAVGIDAVRERITVAVRNAVLAPDGSSVATVEHAAGRTRVRVLDAGGAPRLERWVDGVLWPRVLSADGAQLVLIDQPPPTIVKNYRPPGRTATELVVVSSAGRTDRVTVAANVEPEAFALDARSLFVVEFSPPAAPDRYRVRRMDLEVGGLHDVVSVDKELQQDMRGSARTQAWSRDGSRLYTLYTRGEGDAAAFIHVLDLERKWAHCIDLPPGLGTGPLGTTALAVSTDGTRLEVIDAHSGRAVTIATAALDVAGSSVFTPQPGSRVVAAADGHDVIAVLDGVMLALRGPLRRSTFLSRVERPGAIAIVADRLVTLDEDQVAVRDGNGSIIEALPLPFVPRLSRQPTEGIADGRQLLECAC